MSELEFPDLNVSGLGGLLCIGGNLKPQNLLKAYRKGIFPWPMEGLPLTWFSPPERAILDFTHLHIPRSLERARRRCQLRFSINEAFPLVIKKCASIQRQDQHGTWITPEMVEAYIELHRQGFAHSVETWDDKELVGGIYGVDPGGAFAGESMFHLRPNASKLAFLHLIDHLKNKGLTWIDIQVMTPHMEALGAHLISQDEFLKRLNGALAHGLKLF
jgi:leucyl/phenylalanyl-tRNA---protein transferase